MEVIPLGPGFGVELRGVSMVDVATDDSAYRAVRAAFEQHSVLLFRDQEIADDIQIAFSRAFGPLELTKLGAVGAGSFYSRLTNIGPAGEIVPPDHRQVQVARANQLWHTDSSFKKIPALASVLSARTIPDHGGDTEFVSTRLAWERLPEKTRAELRNRVFVHAFATSRDQIHPELMTPAERAVLPPVRWRSSWRNPVVDRRALYIASHAGAVEGMNDNEGKSLLASLMEEATKPEYVYAHRWRQGDVIMWDNRATMHRGRPWPYDKVRSMIRTTISSTDADGLADLRPAA